MVFLWFSYGIPMVRLPDPVGTQDILHSGWPIFAILASLASLLGSQGRPENEENEELRDFRTDGWMGLGLVGGDWNITKIFLRFN